jgi:hypothetical protein
VVEGSNGGYIREILAITIYGFQWNRPAAMIVGTLVDMATLLNANGDVVSAMLITRISEGRWLSNTLTT